MKNSLPIAGGPSKRRTYGMRWMAFLLVVLSSLTARAQLSGTYTICASGCDYSTIDSAVMDLQNNGVSGAVTMQIKAGSYNESVSITAISGLSATNTLTFKGMGTKPADVYIYDNSNSYVIQLYDISYVTLDNILIDQQYHTDYYVALDIYDASRCTVKNCHITTDINGSGYWNNNGASVSYSSYLLFENNYFRGGHDGVNEGEMNYSYQGNNIYRDNIFTKNYWNGLEVWNSDGNLYEDNYFDSSSYLYASAIYSQDETNAKYHSNTIILGGQGFQYGNWFYPVGYMEIINNTVLGLSGSAYPVYLYPNSSSAEVKFFHNTIHQANSGGTNAVYIGNYNGAQISFRNNILTRNSSGAVLQHYGTKGGGSTSDIFEGNNYYSTGGTIITYYGTGYSSVAAFQSAAAANGTGFSEQNISVTYKGARDLHLDQTTLAPFGRTAGVMEDIDGDTRCSTFPTSGADESTNSANANYKKPSGTKFTGPSKAYIGNPTTFFNSASSSALAGYMWYVDGVKVSDSNHLVTTALKYPSSKVKLIAYNCGGKDSFEATLAVDSPPSVPSTDFISDLNIIRQGEVVQFTDLSTGYPSSWKWDISPKSGVLNGNPTNAFKYVYANDSSAMNKVRFDIPGKYKVCLTASNVRGKGATECKTDYVEVIPAITLKGGTQVSTSASGYIYDNGGPAGNTQAAYYYNPFPGVLIDACADSVYLIFKSFSMYCGYEYVRVYEGKDRQTGKLLVCSGNKQFGAYGPGLTGDANSSCTQICSPIRNDPSNPGSFVYDTFKAAKHMFIEMESNSPGNFPGFEAYYWTKPRSQKAPEASFTAADSVCTNGQVIFTNTTTGQDVTYLWDLDDDMTAFEATSKNTNWPYFAPGSYKITLIAMNCGGSDTFTKTIDVFNPAAPVTAFTADNVTPTVNDVVFFSKDMAMCVDEYTWTITAASGSGQAVYVNGTKNTSALPQVMFTDTGCYNVKLETKNATGTDALQLNCFIKVRGAYCVPTTINKAADLGISKVELNTLSNTSPQGVTSYTNYATDNTKTTTIEIGVTYDLTVSRNTNKNKITRTAWIDWNIDGDFDDAGEKLGEQTNSSTLTWTTPVKVPTLAKTGATLMRIAVNQGSQSNTPCGPNVFGEFEDYRIYVRPDATKPVITMKGEDTVVMEQCMAYVDSGATAWDNLYGNITHLIKTTNVPTFNNMTPGTYLIKYNVADPGGNQADEVRRVVIVTPDKSAPDLVIPKPDTIYVDVFADFTAPDPALAEDCVDGDLLSEVNVSSTVNKDVIGTYTVTYTVTDASGNTATVERVVIVRDVTAPALALVGNATVTHEVGTPYTDADVTVSDNYYSESELRAVMVVQNNVDPNVLGTYTVVYTLTDPSGNGPVVVTRTVIVVDTKAPVVALIDEDPYYLEVNNTFIDPGVSITDNYDAGLSMWDTSGTFYATFLDGFADMLGTYTLTYTVTDGSGNSTAVTRTIIVGDRTAPVGTLKGELSLTVCRWEIYNDPGVDITDNFNAPGDITVTPEGSFTKTWTQLEGLYSLRYKLEDKSGNTSYTEWRKILVLSPNEGNCITGLGDADGMGRYVNVFPNPSSGKFTIQISLPKADQVKITVTDMLGQQVTSVAEGMISSERIDVDLSSAASGVYLLNIQTPAQNVVKRIVINR